MIKSTGQGWCQQWIYRILIFPQWRKKHKRQQTALSLFWKGTDVKMYDALNHIKAIALLILMICSVQSDSCRQTCKQICHNTNTRMIRFNSWGYQWRYHNTCGLLMTCKFTKLKNILGTIPNRVVSKANASSELQSKCTCRANLLQQPMFSAATAVIKNIVLFVKKKQVCNSDRLSWWFAVALCNSTLLKMLHVSKWQIKSKLWFPSTVNAQVQLDGLYRIWWLSRERDASSFISVKQMTLTN